MRRPGPSNEPMRRSTGRRLLSCVRVCLLFTHLTNIRHFACAPNAPWRNGRFLYLKTEKAKTETMRAPVDIIECCRRLCPLTLAGVFAHQTAHKRAHTYAHTRTHLQTSRLACCGIDWQSYLSDAACRVTSVCDDHMACTS